MLVLIDRYDDLARRRLLEQLKASIEPINRSPERIRREAARGEVLVSACCQAPLQSHWPCEKTQQCSACGWCAVCKSKGSFEPEAMRNIEIEYRRARFIRRKR